MSHEVETMAWTNEVPWHGLGTQVAGDLTTNQMLKAAKLDWTVEKQKLFLSDGTELKQDFALVRSKDSTILDVVGPAYTPVQNQQVFDFYKEFVEAGSATMETAGSLKGGRIVWALANLNKSFKLAGKDEVKGYLLFASHHIQGKANVMKFTATRVVCNNTLQMAFRGNGSTVKRAHRGEFDEFAQDTAKAQLGIARDQFSEFAEECLKLSKIKVDDLRAAQLICEAFGASDLENEESYELILKEAPDAAKLAIQALTHSPGAQLPSAKGTAWGVLNGISYTTDHLLRRSVDARVHNAWFGKNSRIKSNAMRILGELE